MSELANRLHRAIEDLRLIQQELERAANPRATDPVRDRVLGDPSVQPLLRELKTLVDHMRHLLWAYISPTAENFGSDLSERLQTVRMQRVTEMLKALEPEISQPVAAPASAEAQTFLELIHNIAHNTIDRHRQ